MISVKDMNKGKLLYFNAKKADINYFSPDIKDLEQCSCIYNLVSSGIHSQLLKFSEKG